MVPDGHRWSQLVTESARTGCAHGGVPTNSMRRAYLRRRSAQSPRKTGSRSRNCTARVPHGYCTGEKLYRTVRNCTARVRNCKYPYRVLEFRDGEQVRRHVRVTRGVPYRRSVALCRLAESRRGGTRPPPYLRRKYGGTRARATVADFGSFRVRGTGTRYVSFAEMP